MIDIAIIGAGQIGKRHLQALTFIDRPVHIQVVDPNYDSLQKAKAAYTEVQKPKHAQKVEYLQDLSLLPSAIDVVIVATSSDVRKSVVENLLQHKDVRYLILEKVVFQHPDHFSEIDHLLTEKKVKTWVNCPLRMVPFYQELKHKLTRPFQTDATRSAPIDYRVSGSCWNMGSNAIHHLDLLSYLTGESDFTLDSSLLDQTLLPSKRPGFIEITGTLFARGDKGSCLTFTSYAPEKIPLLIQISSSTIRCIVKINENTAWISGPFSNWEWHEASVNIPYQSQLTHLAVQQILDKGHCDLPSYTTSWRLHLPLLHSITEHIQAHTTRRDDRCPIT